MEVQKFDEAAAEHKAALFPMIMTAIQSASLLRINYPGKSSFVTSSTKQNLGGERATRGSQEAFSRVNIHTQIDKYIHIAASDTDSMINK